jgi:hypothetical protein
MQHESGIKSTLAISTNSSRAEDRSLRANCVAMVVARTRKMHFAFCGSNGQPAGYPKFQNLSWGVIALNPLRLLPRRKPQYMKAGRVCFNRPHATTEFKISKVIMGYNRTKSSVQLFPCRNCCTRKQGSSCRHRHNLNMV